MRASRLAVLGVLLCTLAVPLTPSAGSAAAPQRVGSAGTPPAWSAPVTIDRFAPTVDGAPLSGISCPSVNRCFAVDSRGQVLSSTEPAGGGAGWRVVGRLPSSLATI